MSNEKKTNAGIMAILEQYESNNKGKSSNNTSGFKFDEKNYFSVRLEKGQDSATVDIRILPNEEGSPFEELHVHKVKLPNGEWKTIPCLKKNGIDKPCPFCEARDLLLSTGKETDKETAKKYSARLTYVAKIISRDAEGDGVKFWRFNHDYSKKGIFDKIHGLITSLKKNRNISDATEGRDITLSIARDQNNFPFVSSITAQDPSPLSEDKNQLTEWTSDTRTWKDVFPLKSYEYMEIIVKGEEPYYDKDNKKWVAKSSVTAEKNVKEEELELNSGLENVKSNIKPATTKSEVATQSNDVEDDLPF